MKGHALCIQNWYEWIYAFILCFAFIYFILFCCFFFGCFLFIRIRSSCFFFPFRPLTKLQQVAKNSGIGYIGWNAIYTQKIRNGSKVKWVICFSDVFLVKRFTGKFQNYTYNINISFGSQQTLCFCQISHTYLRFSRVEEWRRRKGKHVCECEPTNGLNWFAYFSERWNTHSILFNLMHA